MTCIYYRRLSAHCLKDGFCWKQGTNTFGQKYCKVEGVLEWDAINARDRNRLAGQDDPDDRI